MLHFSFQEFWEEIDPIAEKARGKFWPQVRKKIWEKAQELFQH